MTENNQTSETFEIKDEFVISNLETLRVITDSLRLQIASSLSEPRTVKQLATELKIPPSKLYYHINALEEHGLIRVVSTRVVSGIIEKQYQLTARKIRTDPAIFSLISEDGKEDGLETYLSTLFEGSKKEIKQSHKAGLIDMSKDAPRIKRIISAKGFKQLSAAQAEELFKRVADLIKDLEETESLEPSSETQTYGFLLTLYPTQLPSSLEEGEDNNLANWSEE